MFHYLYALSSHSIRLSAGNVAAITLAALESVVYKLRSDDGLVWLVGIDAKEKLLAITLEGIG